MNSISNTVEAIVFRDRRFSIKNLQESFIRDERFLIWIYGREFLSGTNELLSTFFLFLFLLDFLNFYLTFGLFWTFIFQKRLRNVIDGVRRTRGK